MKFITHSDAMKVGLQEVGVGVRTKATLPIAHDVLLEFSEDHVTMTTYNVDFMMQTHVSAQVEGEGACSVDYKTLTNLLKTLPSGNIAFRLDPPHRNNSALTLAIETSNADSKLPAREAEMFPPFPAALEEDPIRAEGREFAAAFRRTSYAMSTTGERPVLQCMKVTYDNDRLTMVATDALRLHVLNMDVDGDGAVDTLLTPEVVDVFRRIANSAKEKQVFLRHSPDRQLVEMYANGVTVTGRVALGTYPNYRQLIPSAGDEVAMEWGDLNALVEAANVFDAHHLVLNFKAETNECEVYGDNESVGVYDGLVRKAQVEKDHRIAFNPEFLADVMAATKTDDLVTLNLHNESSAGVFEAVGAGWGFSGIIMPMFIQWPLQMQKIEASRAGANVDEVTVEEPLAPETPDTTETPETGDEGTGAETPEPQPEPDTAPESNVDEQDINEDDEEGDQPTDEELEAIQDMENAQVGADYDPEDFVTEGDAGGYTEAYEPVTV